MILNVSGRTDIVAFYTPWFLNSLKEGFFDVRNPFNPKLVSRIYLEDVDAIMFCTKNPLPIIKHLKTINKPLLFHVTLTPYKEDIEPNVPSKTKVIEGIKEISKMIGIDNVYVRYDPILLNEKYNITYHQKALEKMCRLLEGYVSQIIVSFLDDYKNVRKNKNILKAKELTKEDFKKIGLSFSKIVQKYNMTIQTCFEEETLIEYGFIKGECFSKEMAYKLTGKEYKKWTARKGNKCECVSMVDIGTYNTCHHFCKYCYANYDEKNVEQNIKQHDPKSSLLIGHLKEDDRIIRRLK